MCEGAFLGREGKNHKIEPILMPQRQCSPRLMKTVDEGPEGLRRQVFWKVPSLNDSTAVIHPHPQVTCFVMSSKNRSSQISRWNNDTQENFQCTHSQNIARCAPRFHLHVHQHGMPRRVDLVHLSLDEVVIT